MNLVHVAQRLTMLTCLLAWTCFGAVGHAALDTDAHVGDAGTGSTVVNGDGSYTVFDEAGVGDIWTSGDDFQYYYDSTPVSADFSSTVRVVSSTADVTGRWGKAGLMIRGEDPTSPDSAFIMFEQHTGNERLADPPVDGNGDVPRLMFRDTKGNAIGENDSIDRVDFLNAPAALPPEPNGVPIWFRIDRAGNEFTSWWANDVDGAPGAWQDEYATGPIADLGGGLTLGVAYSASGSTPAGQHGVTFDNFNVSIVPEPSSALMAMLGLFGASLYRSRRRR